jgi:hypothetical protein
VEQERTCNKFQVSGSLRTLLELVSKKGAGL